MVDQHLERWEEADFSERITELQPILVEPSRPVTQNPLAIQNMTDTAKIEVLERTIFPLYSSGCVFCRFIGGWDEQHAMKNCPTYLEEKSALKEILPSFRKFTCCFYCGLPQGMCARYGGSGKIVGDCNYRGILRSFLAIGLATPSRRSRLSK